MVKNFLITLIVTLSIVLHANCAPIASGSVKYQEFDSNRTAKNKILVLTLDDNFSTSYISSYSASLNIIANDIINLTNEGSSLRAIPLDDLNYKIKQNRLEPEIKKVIYTMKSKGIIDYRTLATICNILGTDKVLLVSGDFNTFKFVIQPHPINSLDLTPPQILQPAYSINTLISLVDPYKQSVMWRKNFTKKFTTTIPQTDFEHNAVTISEINRFSTNISKRVVENVNLILTPTGAITSVNSTVIKTNNIQHKEGATTKDGHSFSTNNKFVKPIQEKYSDWALEHL
ncbi:MAG: hypothetical protein WCF95_01660 [bacterium]